MWSSKISRKSEILILRYSQTKEVFPFVSFCFGNSLIADIFWTGCSISMGFSAKCSFANACYNPIRNWKLNMTDFRLILLDHTTYDWSSLPILISIFPPNSSRVVEIRKLNEIKQFSLSINKQNYESNSTFDPNTRDIYLEFSDMLRCLSSADYIMTLSDVRVDL